jgi:hypothetical protein
MGSIDVAAMKITALLHTHTHTQAELLTQLQERHPQRYMAAMCCNHIKVSRAPPVQYRSVISIECLEPLKARTQGHSSKL